MNSAKIDQFVAERNAALLSLDEARIRAHMRKYGTPLPTAPGAFWPMVHMARLAIISLPPEEKEKSRLWMIADGWEPDATKPMGWRLKR